MEHQDGYSGQNKWTGDWEQNTLDIRDQIWNAICSEIEAKSPSFGSILSFDEVDVVRP